jgi:glycine dehydrogenase subunit 1
MLAEVGISSFEELLSQVPPELRMREALDLAPAETELELRRTFQGFARRNYDPDTTPCFLGAGFYDHVVPALIDQIILRSEFYTAYTPYQAEVSQGTLATIFEFQTLVCELTGMDVANASMYDGASAAAEALLLAGGVTRAGRVLLAPGVHPRTQGVVATYLDGSGIEVATLPEKEGRLDLDETQRALAAGPDVAAVLVQQPNFYGLLEPLDRIAVLLQDQKTAAHLVVSADPLSLGLLAAPGDLGAATVVGDVQPLGIPAQFGGPTAGYFAGRVGHVRRMPGRLVAEAQDAEGRRGFVLTLQTREQHIRREKATSNICTNSALMALRATIFLALLGAAGLRELARECHVRGQWALERLLAVPGVSRPHRGAYFREFVISLPRDAEEVAGAIFARAGILAGVPLSRFDARRRNELLVAVTEKRTREEIEALAIALEQALA